MINVQKHPFPDRNIRSIQIKELLSDLDCPRYLLTKTRLTLDVESCMLCPMNKAMGLVKPALIRDNEREGWNGNNPVKILISAILISD